MNLNNTLCKIFEKDENGDVTIETALVTIGELILLIIIGLVALVIFAAYLYGMWYAIFGEFNQEMQEPGIVGFECMLSGVCVLLTLYIIIRIIVTAYNTIKHTKLAKCPVKKDDNNKRE